MKKITYYIIFICIAAMTCTTALADNGSYRLLSLKQQGDSVLVIVDIDLAAEKVGTEQILTLTPVLSDEKGKETPLRSVLVNGRHRHKAFLREVELNGWQRQANEAHYAMLPLTKENQRIIRYRQSVAYEKWMDGAGLYMHRDLCGCGGEQAAWESRRLAERIDLEDMPEYVPQIHTAYIRPQTEEVKTRNESADIFLDFPVSRTEINPSFGNNPAELGKIERILRDLREDKNLTVTGVTITGYASPEGTVANNNKLSRGRAEALRNYLSMRVGIPSHLYRIGYGGEDWEGLARLVQQSYIEPKSAILSIISYYPNPEERKRRIKALNGGQTYRRLLNELYPRLRRVVSSIEYTLRNFNVEEARQIIKTQPRQLSLDEMFQVANSYGEGSKEFREVFETAVRLYPDDPVTNLNAAASALSDGDLTRGEHYLQKAQKGTPEYNNNLGVLEMLKGNTQRASSLFKRASEGNLDTALKNLEELRKKK